MAASKKYQLALLKALHIMKTCTLTDIIHATSYESDDNYHTNTVWAFRSEDNSHFDLSFSFNTMFLTSRQDYWISFETAFVLYNDDITDRTFPRIHKSTVPDIPTMLSNQGYRCSNLEDEPEMLKQAIINHQILEDEEE